jgi:hypothetical protein
MRGFEFCRAFEYGVVRALLSTAAALTLVANKPRLLKNARVMVIGMLSNMVDGSYAGRCENSWIRKLCCSNIRCGSSPVQLYVQKNIDGFVREPLIR